MYTADKSFFFALFIQFMLVTGIFSWPIHGGILTEQVACDIFPYMYMSCVCTIGTFFSAIFAATIKHGPFDFRGRGDAGMI